MTNGFVDFSEVEVTEKPFSITGTVKVADEAFDTNREDFKLAAIQQADLIADKLVDEALVEYDRRNA